MGWSLTRRAAVGCVLVLAAGACAPDGSGGSTSTTTAAPTTTTTTAASTTTTAPTSTTAPPASAVHDVVQFDTGLDHGCLVRTDGTVWCWGYGGRGQLGNGTGTSSARPVQVLGITTATQVSAGDEFSCALLADHTVSCWGYNEVDEIGVAPGTPGYLTQYNSPRPIAGISGATQIELSGTFACALVTGGLVDCWGDADGGVTWTTAPIATPKQVPAVAGATQVSAYSRSWTCTLVGGVPICWGPNPFNILGGISVPGNGAARTYQSVSNAVSIGNGHQFSCAVINDGTVKCWGVGTTYKLGQPTLGHNEADGVTVAGISGAVRVALGDDYGCALLNNGTVKCWGANSITQLGAAGPDTYVPQLVPGITTASQISADATHTCVLASPSSIKCWGADLTIDGVHLPYQPS